MSSTRPRSSTLQLILLYSPVLIAILVMIPRLLSPQFGLFDDGNSIITAKDISKGDWSFHFDSGNARIRPLYWMPFVFLYNLVGEQPVWFFLLNTFVLCLTVIALIAFLHQLGANNWQSWLAGFIFVLSGAVIENFYTLSKGEGLQMAFISMSLFAITRYSFLNSLWRKTLIVSVTLLLLVCAMFSKETSVAVLPVSVVWAALGLFWAKRAASKVQTWRTPYAISSAIAVGVYFLSRLIFISNAASTSGYTERYIFAISQLISSGIRWAGWLVRDYSYLAVIMVLAFILLISRRGFAQKQLALDMLAWMAAWIVVYLPWNFMTGYYMLPFAFGAAIFTGLILGESVVWRTPLTKILAALSVILIVVSIINNVSTARIQLAVDHSNAQLMSTLATLPANSRVYINIQSPNEYTDQIAMQLLTRYNRKDLVVGLFHPEMGKLESCQLGSCYIVSPSIQNQPLLTVRMGVLEPTQEGWNGSLQKFLGEKKEWDDEIRFGRSFNMLTVDFPRLFCAFMDTRAFCSTPAPIIDMRKFQYGWTVYKFQ